MKKSSLSKNKIKEINKIFILRTTSLDRSKFLFFLSFGFGSVGK